MVDGVFDNTRVETEKYPYSLTYANGTKVSGFTSGVTARSSVASYRSGGRVSHTQTNEELRATLQETHDFASAGVFDSGHPFLSIQQIVSTASGVTHLSAPGTKAKWIGKLTPGLVYTGGKLEFPAFVPWSPNDINYLGAKAINATIPTRPEASLSQFVGELKEGIPRVAISSLKTATNDFRKIGSGYLGLQFGWIPFLKDIINLCESVRDSNKIVQQFVRDSGRQVRRHWQGESQNYISFGGIVDTGHQPLANIPSELYNSVTGPLSLTTEVQEDVWFSGAYVYYVPGGSDITSRFNRYARYANRILGSDVTPELLWELAPWSWLVDWVSDVGYVVSNQQALHTDGLVLRYGYLMRHRTVTNTYKLSGLRFKRGSPTSCTISLTTESKQRVRATPYGFGVDTGSWNPQQWAILGALGATKAPRSLR